MSTTPMSWRPGESSASPYTMPAMPSAMARMARTAMMYFMGTPVTRRTRPSVSVGGSTWGMQCQILGTRCRAGSSLLDPLEQITRLAVEHPAHCLQGAETDSLGATVLEHRHIGRCEPDPFGEFTDAHLVSSQLDVDAHHDGHQITASMSVRKVVACRSSARITTITSPSTVTPITIKNSKSGSPGSSALKPT